MTKHLSLLSGPLAFAAALFLLQPVFTFKAAAALATAVWMALWWIFRPCSIYVTSFVPIWSILFLTSFRALMCSASIFLKLRFFFSVPI